MLPSGQSSSHRCEKSFSKDFSMRKEETSAQMQYVSQFLLSLWAILLICSIQNLPRSFGTSTQSNLGRLSHAEEEACH